MTRKNKNSFICNLFKKDIFLLGFCMLTIFGYFLPYIILSENFPITVHDNLDSIIIWVKILLENGKMNPSDSKSISQLMNGLPISSIYFSYDISYIFFKLFDVYWGFIVNKIIMSLVGFFGMYLLLANYFIPKKEHKLIQFSVALIFALLPFWGFTLSVSGLPLLLYAFLNIRNGNPHYYNWLIIILLAFYSSLVFAGFFFMIVVFLGFIYDIIKTKRNNKKFLLAIVTLGIGYLISHYPLFHSFIVNSDYKTHRFEFKIDSIGLSESFKNAKNMFLNGQYHSHSLHLFILPAVILCLFLIWKKRKAYKIYLLMVIFIFLTSLFYGFINWKEVSSFFYMLSKIIPVQLQRFHTLHPMFWYILFAISLSVILSKLKFGKYVVGVLVFLQLGFVVKNHEFFKNNGQPSFKTFYAQDIFKDIKNYIGKDQSTYRVMSLGIHPAVSLYNGFYTLDGYVANYPLQYKHDFRKIIKGELDKDLVLKKYFDNWGSRCYAFSSELGKNFMVSKHITKKIEHLNFDLDAFNQMGGQYIISAVEINSNDQERYMLKKTFESKEGFWKIYLYQIH